MTVAIESEGRGVMCIKITGAASTAAGGLGAILNPEGVNIKILRGTLYYHVPATTSDPTLSIGVGSTAASTNTDILNALESGSSATADTAYNCFVMQNGAKTISTAPALWQPTYYVTFTGSATTVGLEAYLFLEYIRAV